MTIELDRQAIEKSLDDLCNWACTLKISDIPKDALANAALILGDNIAAIISAADEPEVKAYHQRLMAADSTKQATLFREDGPQLSLLNAALGNGLASTWNELDDGYTKTAVHPGALSQPLILAAAEAHGHSFEDVLLATVGAYEIGTRFARTWPGTLPRIHPHGTFNAVCAAASTMVSPGPYSYPIQGALIRNAWPAAGAWLGHFACEMAELGIGGTASGPYDVFQVGLGAPISKASELNINLGSEWTVSDGYHKLYGACHHSHAAMEALEAMLIERPELRGGQDVKSATVHCSKMAMNFNNATPKTTLGAKFSIPHAIAATLVHGAEDPGNFLDQSLSDQAIKDLSLRVNLVELPNITPWPYDRPAKVSLLLKDGALLENSCEAALGSSARPLDAAQVLTKIHQLSQASAPGLQKAVIKLREEISLDRLGELNFSRWVQSFYRR